MTSNAYYDAVYDTGRESLKRPWPFGDSENEQLSRSATSTPVTNPSSQEAAEPVQPPTLIDNVCFGSIIDTKAQLQNVDKFSRHQQSTRAQVQSFTVVQEGSFFALEYGGSKFARLNKRSCNDLGALIAAKPVTFHAYVPESEWRNALKSFQAQRQCLFPVEINIYGAKADAQEIGNILSKSGAFLQFPQWGLESAEYYNPHLFRIEGFSDQVPKETAKPDERTAHDVNATEDPQMSDSAAVDSILDSLAHHVDLGEINVDRRIKSSLLPHQKEAIDFISRRETGQLASELSLWKYNDVDADEPFYQHVFTGAKRPERDEAQGGIIADEMGLGKSLVILSTIAGTLDQAEEFVNMDKQAQDGRKIRTRATLVLAPSSLLIDSWVDEIRKHTYPGAISFHKHLGPGRHAERDLLQQRMIVFTTYATVATEYVRGNSSLAQFHWFRIVLDEAHDIRNRVTKQFQAVASLSAEHRWCLTGTPIQNSLEDLGALATFLQVPILKYAPTFRKFVTTPITTGSRNRFKNLQLLLQTICLRRTRELLDLPEPIPQIRRLALTEYERAEYDNLLRKCRVEIDMAVSGRRKGRINSTVLESLLKLRLFCNNGIANTNFNKGDKGLPTDADEALTYLQQFERNVCAYCSGTIYSLNGATDADGGIILPFCQHLVCHNCRPQHRAQKEQCPLCASGAAPPIEPTSPELRHTQLTGTHYNNNRHQSLYPTKLLALLQDISRDTTHKSIVFSCWKKTLNLVGELLASHNIRYAMIDGSLPLTERLKVLKDFRSSDGANILLMTLGTGAVGLNLAVASRIYLLEPQWNPSIESQAIGRALRLGQTAQVVIIRYIMKDTVEESNVLSRQRTKLDLAGGGFGKGKDATSERLRSALGVFGIDASAAWSQG